LVTLGRRISSGRSHNELIILKATVVVSCSFGLTILFASRGLFNALFNFGRLALLKCNFTGIRIRLLAGTALIVSIAQMP
jgi:hypothetical protein